METYKSPISIYVLWHPAFKAGAKFAEDIYKTFCRNTDMPLGRQIGVPTFFRSASIDTSSVPIAIPLEEADRNALIVLIDEEMFNDTAWEQHVSDLVDSIAGKAENRLYPVSLHKHATSFCEDKLVAYQFIMLNKLVVDEPQELIDKQRQELNNRLLHDLSRQMLNQKTVAEVNRDEKECEPEPPVKLFISHAKKDGLPVASQFRDYINSETKLKTFFDANDIADGFDFADQIERNIDQRTALVVFHTDEYSDREWCRIEIIEAKRIKSPIVVVYDITKGEKRSFPYLGNVPTIRWSQNFEAIIELTLIQVLNNRFNEEYLKKHIDLYGLANQYECIELTSPPELFNYLLIVKKANKLKLDGLDKEIVVLYPDPPLGPEELRILNEMDDNVHFTTPTYTFQLPIQ